MELCSLLPPPVPLIGPNWASRSYSGRHDGHWNEHTIEAGGANMILAIASLVLASSQQVEPPAATLRVEAQEVLIDAVVRDRQRRLVSNLKIDEVQVVDNGVPQRIRSFRFVTREPGAGAPRFDPNRELHLIAIVCMGMDNSARRSARVMLHDFLSAGLPPDTWAAVFTMHRRLGLVEEFTDRMDRLRPAIDLATVGEYKCLEVLAGERALALFRPARLGDASESSAPGDERLRLVQLSILKMERRLVQDVLGQSDLEGLRALVRRLAGFRGRKTVLLASQGLLLPDDHGQWLGGVIAEANRANVTFYVLNTAALRPGSRPGSRDFMESRGQGEMFLTDRNDWGLQTLASSTGGFYMADSNDQRAPLRRVMEEVAAHYEISYTPGDQKWDGRYHKVELKTARPKVTVQSRNGYFALPALRGELVQAYELPGLAAMDANPPPREVDYAMTALRFGGSDDLVPIRIAFEIPTRQLRRVLPEGQQRQASISITALVKDAAGAVIEKRSTHLADSNAAEFLLTDLAVDLAPGRYTLESAVVDHNSTRAGVRRSVLIVPPRSTPEVSDVVLVASLEPPRDAPGFGDPLQLGTRRIRPKAITRFSPPASGSVPIYFVHYPKPASPETRIAVELRSAGRTLAAEPLNEAGGDTGGARPYFVSIPVVGLPPGPYEVVVNVVEAGRRLDQMAVFELTGAEAAAR